ncbi:hypothetical protein CMV_015460 [Castanea mollissima]|uniref:Uncharacterized protein n=1 Tax=Castanea mollissima TaxID=60419 RepID=A0A8J4VG01_9ROSI|nr:hypothetical protein CMV_015460 [Castanea mollissima]
MLGKVRTHGRGCFIVLPDIPSRDDLPSFYFKKSCGLLSGVAESNCSERLISELAREIVNNSGGGGGGGRGNGVVDVIGVRRLPLERGVRSSVNESADLELSWIFV